MRSTSLSVDGEVDDIEVIRKRSLSKRGMSLNTQNNVGGDAIDRLMENAFSSTTEILLDTIKFWHLVAQLLRGGFRFSETFV